MSEKKYTVVCNGQKVEVTKEVYKLYITDPETEARVLRRRKKGRIIVDMEKEKIEFIDPLVDSFERIRELGVEFEDTSFSVEALDNAVMVEQALDKLSYHERYIIEALFFNEKTERQVADELNTTQNKINYEKKQILCKLNKILRKE